MVQIQLSSSFSFIAGLLLLGQVSLIQCSSQSQLIPPNLPTSSYRTTGENPSQPIGIDFGSDYVIASYAHSPTNVSILSMIGIQQGGHAAYFYTMFLLYMADDSRAIKLAKLGLGERPLPTTEEVVDRLKRLFRDCLLRSEPTISFLNNPMIKNLASWIWMSSLFNKAADILDNAFVLAIEKAIGVIATLYPREAIRRRAQALTELEIKESFYSVIQELSDNLFKDHGISMKYAVISIPSYYPPHLAHIPNQACADLGINSPELVLYKRTAAFKSVITEPGDRILLLDHGRYYMDVHVLKRYHNLPRKPIKSISKVADQFCNTEHIRSLFEQVTSRGVLKEQFEIMERLHLDDEIHRLRHEIGRARLLIKDKVFDVLVQDVKGDEEDRHHDVWPLNIDNWWSESTESLVLAWDDLKVVEDSYVEALSGYLDTFLKTVREDRDCCLDGPPVRDEWQEIDLVIIVTDQLDGDLLRRAVKLTLGDGVRIYGGGSMVDFAIAANGAAVIAFDS